jgi:hypothetical protein
VSVVLNTYLRASQYAAQTPEVDLHLSQAYSLRKVSKNSTSPFRFDDNTDAVYDGVFYDPLAPGDPTNRIYDQFSNQHVNSIQSSNPPVDSNNPDRIDLRSTKFYGQSGIKNILHGGDGSQWTLAWLFIGGNWTNGHVFQDTGGGKQILVHQIWGNTFNLQLNDGTGWNGAFTAVRAHSTTNAAVYTYEDGKVNAWVNKQKKLTDATYSHGPLSATGGNGWRTMGGRPATSWPHSGRMCELVFSNTFAWTEKEVFAWTDSLVEDFPIVGPFLGSIL